jgi:predicted metal-dependent hydrolase
MVVILFTTQLPNKTVDALEAQGLEVHEALAISEVLALAEQDPISSIIITPDVEQARADVIALHYPTTRLTKEFAIQQIFLN